MAAAFNNRGARTKKSAGAVFLYVFFCFVEAAFHKRGARTQSRGGDVVFLCDDRKLNKTLARSPAHTHQRGFFFVYRKSYTTRTLAGGATSKSEFPWNVTPTISCTPLYANRSWGAFFHLILPAPTRLHGFLGAQNMKQGGCERPRAGIQRLAYVAQVIYIYPKRDMLCTAVGGRLFGAHPNGPRFFVSKICFFRV